MNKKVLLKHDTSLKHNLSFDVLDEAPLYNKIINPNGGNIYAVMTQSISSSSKRFSPIHIMYLFNLNTLQFEDISVSDVRFKVNDVKAILTRSNVEDGSIIITLDITPFSITALSKYFESRSFKQITYKRGDFIPMLDYIKNYLHGKVLILMLTTKRLSNEDVREIAFLWNEVLSPIMIKISERYGLKSDIIFKK